MWHHRSRMDIESNRKVLQIAAANPNWFIRLLVTILGRLKKKRWGKSFFHQDHVGEGVALGEIGLDYKIRIKKELQGRVFEKLLDIAHESNKPVIIHCRYSQLRTFESVKKKMIKHAVFIGIPAC